MPSAIPMAQAAGGICQRSHSSHKRTVDAVTAKKESTSIIVYTFSLILLLTIFEIFDSLVINSSW